MAKDPAFLFYSSDFLTGTADMTNEEKGQYITLLCLQHQKGRLSKKAVAVAVPDATADVLAKFRQDEDGNFYNERLEIEAEKRRIHSQKQKERALKGWEKRRATADATALPLENEDENRIEIKSDKGVVISELIFSKFGITDMMPASVEQVNRYVRLMEVRDKIDYFSEKVQEYFERKKGGTFLHGLDNFLGDEGLENGAWNKPVQNNRQELDIENA